MNRGLNQQSPAGRCIVIAHRGASGVAPENTLAAVRAAVEAGADACELDVRATKDGYLVLLHDAILDRTTDGAGLLQESTLAAVRMLDAGAWMERPHAGERVPTLREVLDELKGSPCEAVVELKESREAEGAVREIKESGMMARSVVISFDGECLHELTRSEPRLRIGLLVDEELSETARERADALAARAKACGAGILDLHHSMLDEHLIRNLHRLGLLVWAWAVNDPARLTYSADGGLTA